MRLSRRLSAAMIVGTFAAAGCTSSNAPVSMASEGGATEGGGETEGGGGTEGGAATGNDGSAASDASGISDAEAGVKTCGPFADGGGPPLDGGGHSPSAMTTFFVSSEKSMTGNLGGLSGADMRCQTLATAAGLGGNTWHAYLSVEHDAANGNNPTNAKDRIGAGPWYNANGVMLAADVSSLHARTGDPTVFIDEMGRMINGQWTGAPSPLEHDILTGSNADGTLAPGKTCLDWTSSAAADAGVDGGELEVARVGHTDGLGPMCSMATTPNNLPSWNSAHDNAGCDNTAPRGGAGRIYCFAIH